MYTHIFIYNKSPTIQEVGGRFRPLSEITGVCPRCKEQIDWKRRYGKYKPLHEPAKWYYIVFFSAFCYIYINKHNFLYCLYFFGILLIH